MFRKIRANTTEKDTHLCYMSSPTNVTFTFTLAIAAYFPLLAHSHLMRHTHTQVYIFKKRFSFKVRKNKITQLKKSHSHFIVYAINVISGLMNNFSMLAFSLDVNLLLFFPCFIVARFVRAESRRGWFVRDVHIEFTRSLFVYKTENIDAKMYFTFCLEYSWFYF